MSQTRTTVVLDDDLIKRAKVIAKVDSTTAAITAALEQMVRKAALDRLAELVGSDPDFGDAPPRRRPPEFVNSPGSKETK